MDAHESLSPNKRYGYPAITPRHERGFYCIDLWATPKLITKQNTKRMSRRTTAIAAALSVLALGSPLVGANANPLADNFFNSGVDKYKQGDYQGAIADYAKAIEINPQDVGAYTNRGIAKNGLKDYQGAIADYNKALEINPKDAIAYSNRGASKELIGDLKGACDDWRKAVGLGEEDPAEWVKKQC